MTVKTVSVAPEYLSFYMSGSWDVDVPVVYGAQGTDDCLVITCQYWNDGDTTITMGPCEELPVHSMPLVFDGMLSTPTRSVLLHDVYMPEILRMDVHDTRTRVRIWSNHENQPDVVVIGLG
jgi:hypothetical protein